MGSGARTPLARRLEVESLFLIESDEYSHNRR